MGSRFFIFNPEVEVAPAVHMVRPVPQNSEKGGQAFKSVIRVRSRNVNSKRSVPKFAWIAFNREIHVDRNKTLGRDIPSNRFADSGETLAVARPVTTSGNP
jgi:hypothetical protein